MLLLLLLHARECLSVNNRSCVHLVAASSRPNNAYSTIINVSQQTLVFRTELSARLMMIDKLLSLVLRIETAPYVGLRHV